MENNYEHKKFSQLKRKREEGERLSPVMQEESQVSSSKRHQSSGFFRPWLDKEAPAETTQKRTIPSASCTPALPPISQYHANMVRFHAPRQRSPKAQQRRDRNTLACLLSRRAKQAQQAQMEHQYTENSRQHAAILEQQLRLSLYYRQLLQQAAFQQGVNATAMTLPQQQQQFLQQMAISQQVFIFGPQR